MFPCNKGKHFLYGELWDFVVIVEDSTRLPAVTGFRSYMSGVCVSCQSNIHLVEDIV